MKSNLSACALTCAATGDEEIRANANQLVSALAACQKALGASGYLSAYPEEFIVRVETGKRIWSKVCTPIRTSLR